MDETNSLILGALFIVIGGMLIKFKDGAGRKASQLYKRVGIEVPDALYSKQFSFIGILLIIVGFLTGAGLLKFL